MSFLVPLLFTETDGVGFVNVEVENTENAEDVDVSEVAGIADVAEVVGGSGACDNGSLVKGVEGGGGLGSGAGIGVVGVGGTKIVTVGATGGWGCRVCTTVTVIGPGKLGTPPPPSCN